MALGIASVGMFVRFRQRRIAWQTGSATAVFAPSDRPPTLPPGDTSRPPQIGKLRTGVFEKLPEVAPRAACVIGVGGAGCAMV